MNPQGVTSSPSRFSGLRPTERHHDRAPHILLTKGLPYRHWRHLKRALKQAGAKVTVLDCLIPLEDITGRPLQNGASLTKGEQHTLRKMQYARVREAKALLKHVDAVCLPGNDHISCQHELWTKQSRYRIFTDDGGNEVLDSQLIVDMSLANQCRKDDRPIMGICRGHQVLNRVYEGKGKLVEDGWKDSPLQHLHPDYIDPIVHTLLPQDNMSITRKHISGDYDFSDQPPSHPIHIDANSAAGLLFRLDNRQDTSAVNVCCLHTEVIDPDRTRMAIIGRSADNVPEAAVDPDLSCYLGLQFHPELRQETSPLIRGFVAYTAYAKQTGAEKDSLCVWAEEQLRQGHTLDTLVPEG